MSAAASKDSALPPIRKLTARKWKTLPETGGSVAINDAKLKQGYIGNLQKKSCIEIEELIMRQEKILSNTAFVEKLPDKGKKIKERKEDLQKALEKARNQAEDVTIPDVDALEWQWRDPRNPSLSSQNGLNGAKDTLSTPLDSDDDEDPLELLASHSRDVPLRSRGPAGASDVDPSEVIREELKKLELMDQEEIRVPSKITEASSTKPSSLVTDFGSKLIISMEKKSKPSREVFKPFRSLKHQHLLSDEHKEQSSNSNNSSPSTIIEVDKNKCSIPSQPVNGHFLPPDSRKKVLSNPHVFGEPAKLGAGVNISSSSKVSPLWACESSATGPINSRSKGLTSVKLVSLRESVLLEKEAMERSKKAQLDEATARLRVPKQGSNSKPNHKYKYKDVNIVPHVLEEDDNLTDVFSHHRGICVVESDSGSDSDED